MYIERPADKKQGASAAKGARDMLVSKYFARLKDACGIKEDNEVCPKGKLAGLPPISHYIGTGESTRHVSSGEAKSIFFSGDYDGLYTTGVNTCSALAIVAKSPDGKVFSATLAHISVLSGREEITGIFAHARKISGHGATLEASVIGGIATAQLVLEVAKENGTVKLEFIDSEQRIGHSLLVGRDGRIYYGRRFDLDIICSN